MEKKVSPQKTIVLKPNASQEEITDIAEKKKTGLFGTVFTRPKPEEIDISSVSLYYEPYWIVKGKYSIDFFRKAIYEYNTDPEVTEVIIGKGTFPVRSRSGAWDKFRKSMKVGEKENKLDVPVEEHVELDIEDELILNGQGKEVKFKYKVESNNMESFPDDVLKTNEKNVRPTSLDKEKIVEKLINTLTENIGEKSRVIKETVEVERLEQVYVPIYEARCVDSKNKVEVLRIDGMDLKIL